MIVFEDMIAGMFWLKTEYFKLIHYPTIYYSYTSTIIQLYFRWPQQFAFNNSSDVGFDDFMTIYRKCTNEPYSFLANDTTFSSDNPLTFRKNLIK